MGQRSWRAKSWYISSLFTVALWTMASAQLRYSVTEEVTEGTIVGNVAKDLGLDKSALKDRKYRIVSGAAESLFHVDQKDGNLYVSRKIDREEVCEKSTTCLINLKTVLENPLEVHYVGVEVQDINDNAPIFPESETTLEISESVLPGFRIPLKAARDLDSGPFSIQHYKLSANEHFRLDVKDKGDDGKIPTLIVQKPLDRETEKRHALVLTALDGGKPPKSGITGITVNVLDVNDNLPIFMNGDLSVMLHENVPIGTTVIQVNATDLDEGANGDVIYSFSNSVSQRLLKLLEINPTRGEILVKGQIDYEEKDKYEIEVEASDKGVPPLATQKNVIIKIVDVNDNAPEIEVTSFSSSIPEDSRPGTTVALISVNDRDSGLNGKVTCTIEGDVPFTLSPSLQDKMFSLVTKSALDRETQSQYVLSIVATDHGQPSLKSEKNILIVISDVNDNSPEFVLKPYSFYITEGNEAGAQLFSVQANDKDEGENAHISYHIYRDGSAENKVTSFLNINSENGQITALKSFDFETLKSFQFQVVASDSGTPSLSSNATVHVFILDQNDNAPVILYPVRSNGSAEGVEEIPRNVNAGHLVTKVRAYDSDIGYNGWLLFSLQEVTDHSLFGLDRYTGQIRTLRSFTETDEAEHKLVILVKDNGNVSLSATATVLVKVVEPREAFAASDVKSSSKDSEDTNVTFYLMITLASVSALFILSIIVLIAMQCSKSSTDYTSKYLQDTNYDGTLCHSIQYRSGDKRYMLVGPRMSVGSTIVPGSQANTLVLPDRRRPSEEVNTFSICTDSWVEQFQVVASDSGTPSLSSNATVHVFILDQNDNAPVILYPVRSNGSAEGVEEIPRNVNAGHLVTKVRAYDSDIGYNGWLLFSLQEVTDHSLFGLDRYTGQIRTLRSFTETDEAEHKLVILVKDNGNVSLSATATVLVKVVEPREAFAASDVKSSSKDSEDTNVTFYLMITLASVSALFILSIIVLIAMQCSKSSTDYTSKYLQDTNYDGTLCHSIQYRSGDKRYMLVGPRMSVGSTIVPGSQANTLVLPDRRRPSEETTMGIKRSFLPGISSWIALCSALLLFSGQFVLAQIRYSVPEEVRDGTVVGNVAKDLGLDTASLDERRFRVVSETNEAIFAVNSDNGALYVHGRIDREQLCQGSGTCLMELKVLVENPLEVHYVVVEITDVNDHAPTFPKRNETIEIAEHTLSGKRFQLHSAHDPDAGMNSVRTYSLSANEHFDINIRETNGEKIPFLVLKKMLDREKSSEHSLVVTAVDGGKPQRSGTLNVTIIVLDINDNRPVFSQEIYEITAKENLQTGTSIFKLTATDPDEGTNGEIDYSLAKILKQRIYDIFELDTKTGDIVVKGHIDYEENDFYELEVQASDKGTPPLTGECRVIIKIIDVNDNSPEIDVTSLSNTVSEDSKPGTVVSLIRVKDKDSGVNGKIIAHITNNVPFELKPSYKENTYSVVTKDFLDREEVSHYDITIKATDCGEPPLSTTKTLSIQILDVNDNSPQFEQNPLYFYIVENNVAGTSLFSVTASDKDKNENADISYSIARAGQEKDVTLFLNVNAENGQITALKSFDFETLKSFQFQVVASDSGTPSLSSNATVHVFILDQNDNAPVILYPVRSNGSAEGVEEIPRNVNAGHLVTKVRAYDSDIGYNGWLLFSLQEVTDHSLFGLDRYTGQIRTLRSFTETDEAEHKLVILVKDNGNVSLSATATVLVKVVEPREAFAASDVKSSSKDSEDTNVTFYLMITLASVSALFILSIIVLIAMQCSKSSTDYTSKYLQDTNYDGTLCHSIQYRSGDKRYMLVGPRMSVGSTIVPGSQANTLVLPDRRRPSEEVNTFLRY
ncbi:protocadherin Fat 4-like [Boleophthalmus pectinirostris]|uniref:protocadherin Fat 4-like n=1 Tax=Boleophthalmus pectinirostris TaxID=150288 RepID=UPI00242A376B|nr:protocadherin Fat 4-like [Boleophthalmus pectinirostris]